MIEIYLVRHGLAGKYGDCEDDSLRSLTIDGIKRTQKVAQRLKACDIKFDLVLTSPYVRALKTAMILQSVGLVENLQTLDELQPEGDRTIVLSKLESLRTTFKRVAIVGHEPDLSQLASTLFVGDDRANLTLKKAGLIGLLAPIEGELIGQCQLFWLAPPRFLVS
jgi:phosphohistidine phosphatase